MNCGQLLCRAAVGMIAFSPALLLADDDPTPEQHMPSVISGVVVEPGGQPSTGSTVAVLDSTVVEPFTSVTTDDSGRFVLRGPLLMPRRGLSLIARSKDERLQSMLLVPPVDDQDTSNTKVAATHTGLRVELKPVKSIDIVATDATGAKIPDAIVIVQSGFHEVTQRRTDANGLATVTYPADATLQSVICYKPDIGFDYRSFESTYLAADRTHPNKLPQQFEGQIEFILDGVSHASVTVLDPDGNPAAGIRVAPWLIDKPDRGESLNLSGMASFGRQTNGAGVATFDFLPRDHQRGMTFWPRIEHNRWYFPERANLDWESPDRNVTVRARRTISVSGFVRHANGSPAAGIRVAAYGGTYAFDGFHHNIDCDTEGRWSMNVYPDGYYIFAVRDKSWAAKAHAGIIIREGQAGPQDLDFTLYPAVRVHGVVRIAGIPAAPSRGYIMLQQQSPNYYDLPEASRLPNPQDSNRAISSFIQETTSVNEDGTYQFYVGAGDFIIWSPDQKTQEFTITDQPSVQFDFDLDAPLSIVTKGKVVYASNPMQMVVGAKVTGRSAELRRGDLFAVTNSDGEFELQRDNVATVVHAASPDGKHAGVTKLNPGEEEFVLPIAPTCAAFGQLISEDGELLAGRAIEYGIELKSDRGTMSWLVHTSTLTDDQGYFQLDGLAAGHEHKVSVVAGFGANGEPRSWRNITTLTPTERLVDLEHLVQEQVPPTVSARKRSSLAFGVDGDPTQRMRKTSRDARLSNQHVMLLGGSSTSDEAIDFFGAFDQPLVRQELAGFRLLALESNADQPENQEFLRSLEGRQESRQDDLEIHVIDSEGKQIASTTYAELTEDSRPIDESLLEFALEHTPETKTAEELLKRAMQQASHEGKHILLQFTSVSCLPALMLSRYFDQHKDAWSKDFVWLKLDAGQNLGTDALADRFRGKDQYSLPWTAILSSDGDLIQAGEADGVSIGFPLTTTAREKFKQMLQFNRKRMSNDEIEAMAQALEKPETTD